MAITTAAPAAAATAVRHDRRAVHTHAAADAVPHAASDVREPVASTAASETSDQSAARRQEGGAVAAMTPLASSGPNSAASAPVALAS